MWVGGRGRRAMWMRVVGRRGRRVMGMRVVGRSGRRAMDRTRVAPVAYGCGNPPPKPPRGTAQRRGNKIRPPPPLTG